MTKYYPGLPVPLPIPETGRANHVPTPPAPPTVAKSGSGPLNPPAPATHASPGSTTNVNVEIGHAVHNGDPYNTKVPVIGVPKHTPLVTPLGTHPQFLTPTDPNWYYQGGSNG